jgi:hypothetical protein
MNTDKPVSELSTRNITATLVALTLTLGMGTQSSAASNKRRPPVASGAKPALKIAAKEAIAANEKDSRDEKGKDEKDVKSDKNKDGDKKAQSDKEKDKKKAEEKAKADAKAAKKDDKQDKNAKGNKGDKNAKAEGKGFFKGIFGKEEGKDIKEATPAATTSPAAGDEAAAAGAAASPAATPAQPVQPPAPPVSKASAAPVVDTANGAEPKFIPDSALISILKDISKSLADNEDVKNVQDPAQKMAIKLAGDTLAKALANPDLSTDRIIAVEDRPHVETRLIAESWDSQLVQLSPNCTASLSALWAKRANGLVNISIAGTCNCKPTSATTNPETKIGEWIVVLSGKSAVDKGFDIQTQQEVPFWLGKLSSFTVEATACSQEAAEPGKKPQSPALVLKSVLTERGRKHLEALSAWQSAQKLAVLQAEQERTRTEDEAKALVEAKAKEQEKLKLGEEKARMENELRARLAAEAALKAVAEQKAKELAETDAQSKQDEKAKAETELKAKIEAEVRAKAEEEARAKAQEELKSKLEAEAKAQVEAELKAKLEAEAKAKVEAEAKAKEEAELKAKAEAEAKAKLASTAPSSTYNYGENRRTWESPAPVASSPRIPGGKANLVLPDRAVAGQYLTASAVNDNHGGEQYVELTFNGTGLTTSGDGKVHFMVPEEAPPGPTMLVALPSNPLEAPKAMEVLQPLMVPATQQVPRIDKANPLVAMGDLLTIDGHSFDGVGDNNRVIIDGAHDARVLAASPVQLKVELPRELISGHHSVTVSTAGLRSNPTFIDVVSVRIETLGKDDLRKIKVCVLGTQNRVTLKLLNRSPGIIKLTKGDEQYVTTAGGPDNHVMVSAQRVAKGSFSIDAKVEHPTAVSRAY